MSGASVRRLAACPATCPAGGRRQRGMLLLELVLVVILVALLFMVAIDRLLPLRGQAEGAAVLGSLGAMQASLGSEVADRVLRGGSDALLAFENANPVDFLSRPPAGYRGPMASVDAAALAPGEWAFDRGRGVLVYRVRFSDQFRGSLLDPPRGEWKIELQYRDGERTAERIRGVLLVPLAETEWVFD